MKRLPFALVALSLSVPVVACLNASNEDSGSSEDNLDQAVKADCNFGFTPLATPIADAITFADKSDLAPGKRVAFADLNGDGKTDFAVAIDNTHLQTWLGKGDGTFTKSAAPKQINNFVTGRKRVALSTIAVGDFDGDKVQDVVIASTSIPSAAGADPTDLQVDYRVVFGKKDGTLALDMTVYPGFKDTLVSAVVGDANGDGNDDLALVTKKSETVLFGVKSRKLEVSTFKYAATGDRKLAFITPKTDAAPASLVIATADKLASISFDVTTRAAASPTETAWGAFSDGVSRIATDIDGNGSTEIALQSDKLSITTFGGGAPLTFDGMSGKVIAALDLDQNAKPEIVYAGTDTQLFAACGYAPNTQALGAAPLKIPYDTATFIAGALDLNGDKKIDFVTLPVAGGEFKVFLGGTRESPAPDLMIFNSNLAAPAPDAGTDSTTTTTTDASDATTTTTTTDASDATAPIQDAGAADVSAPPVDAGHPVTDAGHATDAGHPAATDAGSKPTTGDDDDDDGSSTPEPPSDEGSGSKPKKPTTKPSSPTSSSSSGAVVTVTPHPQAVNDGCSAAPGSHGVTGTAFGGIFAAMMLLARRRRRNG